MADLKISQLPDAAVPLEDEDYIPVVQGTDTDEPSTNKVRVSELRQAVDDLEGKLDNAFKFPVSEGYTNEHGAEILYPKGACYSGSYSDGSGIKVTGILEIRLPAIYYTNRIIKIKGKIERHNPNETIDFQLGGYFSGKIIDNWYSIRSAQWSRSLNDLQDVRVRFGYTIIDGIIQPTIYIGELTTQWFGIGSFVIEQASLTNDPISDEQLNGMKSNWSLKIIDSEDIVSNLSTVFVPETDLSGYAKLDGGNDFDGPQNFNDSLKINGTRKYITVEGLSGNRQAEYVGNWSSDGRWGIGPNTNTVDNTVRIGVTDGDTWRTGSPQNTNLIIGGNMIAAPATEDNHVVIKEQLDTKLDTSAYNDRFKGKYTSQTNLQSAFPIANVGDYAQVDEGPGFDVVNYNWDTEGGWVQGGSGSSATTTDALPEGSSNKYFTDARAQTALTTSLASKADDTDVVHKSGVETITDLKIFNSGVGVENEDTTPGQLSLLYPGTLQITGNDKVSNLEAGRLTFRNGQFSNAVIIQGPTNSGGVKTINMPNANGTIALTSDLTGFANDANVVHKTGNETVAGDKTFTGVIVSSQYLTAPYIETNTGQIEDLLITNVNAYDGIVNYNADSHNFNGNTIMNNELILNDNLDVSSDVNIGGQLDVSGDLNVEGSITTSTPTTSNQVATKGYVDSKLYETGDLSVSVTGDSNVSSVTFLGGKYTKIDNTVSIYGKVSITPTSLGATIFDIDLPYLRDYSASDNGIYGHGTALGSWPNYENAPCLILADGEAEGNVSCAFKAPITTAMTVGFSFTYTTDGSTP